ncbi:MAG: hypothetical protein D6800_01595, partial [Candidatus Zixiibacteriota bacterium]
MLRKTSAFSSWVSALIIGAALLLSSHANSQPGNSPFQQAITEQPVDARFLFSLTSAPAGDTYAAAAVLEIKKGWHINSAHPYESMLIPAALHIDTVDGIIPTAVRYPEGENVDLLGSKMSVYEGKTTIP